MRNWATDRLRACDAKLRTFSPHMDAMRAIWGVRPDRPGRGRQTPFETKGKFVHLQRVVVEGIAV
jgi:hypothetical protein